MFMMSATELSRLARSSSGNGIGQADSPARFEASHGLAQVVVVPVPKYPRFQRDDAAPVGGDVDDDVGLVLLGARGRP
jgi:hypothetical protein